MKNRILALLLVLTMALSLLAACGEKDAKKEDSKKAETEEEAPEFAKGFYAVLNEDEETVAYLHSTGKKLTVYDADGNELMAQTKFSWDDEEEAFVIDETAAFTLEISKKTTSFSVPKKSPTGLDKGTYTLEKIEEEDIPVPAAEPDPQPTPDPDPTPVPDPVPAPDPAPDPVPASNYVTLPTGVYKIVYYGIFLGYFEYDGIWLTYYEEDGEATTSFVSYDAATGFYTDDADAVFHIEKSDDGFVLLQEDSDEPMELYPIDALPDFESENPGTSVPASEFYPVTPEDTNDFIALCSYKDYLIWDYIPDFFIPGWVNMSYAEDSTGSSFTISAQDDSGLSGTVILLMSDSLGANDTISNSIVESFFDKDEDNVRYDSMVQGDGIQTGVIDDCNVFYRWHDTITKDSSGNDVYNMNFILLMDNGTVSLYLLMTGTAPDEDSYLDFSDVLFEFAQYLHLYPAEE